MAKKSVPPGNKPSRGVSLGFAKDPFSRGTPGLDKDYTRYIKWTPRNVAIAVLILGVPYSAVVAIIATSLSWMAALPFLVLLIVVAAFIGILYGLAKISI